MPASNDNEVIDKVLAFYTGLRSRCAMRKISRVINMMLKNNNFQQQTKHLEKATVAYLNQNTKQAASLLCANIENQHDLWAHFYSLLKHPDAEYVLHTGQGYSPLKTSEKRINKQCLIPLSAPHLLPKFFKTISSLVQI